MSTPSFMVTAVSIIVLIFIFIVEYFIPQFGPRSHRLVHGMSNAAVGFIGGLITVIVFSGFIRIAMNYTQEASFGLVHVVTGPVIVKAGFAFIVFDLWMYAWHRANHTLSFLWLFHRAHHTETEMDVTTALRFHPGEILISNILLLAVIMLIGLNVAFFAVYKLFFNIIVFFHHSNIRMPQRWDRLMRTALVSPNMHRVHHSDIRSETDSNYASVFSFWDRLFGSYRKRQDVEAIRYGLSGMKGAGWRSLRGMLTTPFRTVGSVKKKA